MDDVCAQVESRVPMHEDPPLRWWMEAREGYVLVRYAGLVGSLEIADRWLARVDAFLLETGRERVLWDSRPAEVHPPEVRDRIWQWLSDAKVLKRSAILVESEMLRLSAHLSSVGGGPDLRSFHDFTRAERFLNASA